MYDFISTSKIVETSPQNQLKKPLVPVFINLIGEGQKAQVQLKDFELLRHGFSAEQITQLNLAPIGFFH